MWAIAASAIIALAAWPAFVASRSAAVPASDPIAQLTAAPVRPDYLSRDKSIAFLESRYEKDSADMITPRRLSGEYLQRYREHGDVADVLRAEAAARTSLRVLPRGNPGGDLALANAYLTMHRFRSAKTLIVAARADDRSDPNVAMSEASIDMELGEYEAARRLIRAYRGKAGISSDAVAARWYEISGKLDEGRRLFARAAAYADSIYETPAERRAWYHFRMGELAYLAGDTAEALAQERTALRIYPEDVNALQALARIAFAAKRDDEAFDAAKRAAAIVPAPEVLGILADEYEKRGSPGEAAAARAQIEAVEKIGNAQHVNDRLIAMYLADHDLRPHDAYRIAKREIAVRDDVYAEDTLAWCAAKDGRWAEARGAARKALRFDTQDARMQYHAAVIARHSGDRVEALRRYERALALNPEFSARQADDARAAAALLKQAVLRR